MKTNINIPFGLPIIGNEEKKRVSSVLNGTQLVHGPMALEFENNFCNFVNGGYAVSLNSCTAGLHLSYLTLGLGPGDEVIIPAQSHVATAHAVEYTGAKPVFVDVEIDTGNICLERLENAITSSTKAIGIVHFAGLPVKMDEIKKLAKKNNLSIVEDAALALGAKYKGTSVGLLGDTSSFSFYPVKHITTLEGGMLLTKDEDFSKKIRRMRAFGYDKMVGERSVPGLYDVDMLGYNFRMNEIQAAIGIEQLKKLNGFLKKRNNNSSFLRRELKQIDEIICLSEGTEDLIHANYCLIIILDNSIASSRAEIINKLKENGIGTSIYYPGPIPNFKYYREKYKLRNLHFPNAKRISDKSIALPVGPHVDEDDLIYISDKLKEIIVRL